MRKIKVSFILGILNAERTLEGCLNGILKQKFPEKYEIIIIDGGSKDRTLYIIKEYMKKNKQIRLLHNPKKLSEGKGMSKDMGINSAVGEIVILLDHDNIILKESWLSEIVSPFKDKHIMASQSLLNYREKDTNFLKYVNSIGVEDPFAIPYSLVAQVQLNPRKFKLIDNYYLYTLDKENVLFGGANGCAFRKKVFDIIGGYSRDVDVFAKMAEKNMQVAIPKLAYLHHDTANNFLTFMKKKGIYFYRFIENDYANKSFKWVERGFSKKIRFFIMIFLNLSLIVPFIAILNKFIETKKFFWLLHPFYLFFITLEYGFITLIKFKNFLKYIS